MIMLLPACRTMANRKLRTWPTFNVLASAVGQTRAEHDVWVKLEPCTGRFRGPWIGTGLFGANNPGQCDVGSLLYLSQIFVTMKREILGEE